MGDKAGTSPRARLLICGVDDDFFRPGGTFPFDSLRFREGTIEETGEFPLETCRCS